MGHLLAAEWPDGEGAAATGAALFKDGGLGASWGSAFDITDQFLRAGLLFSAAGCFRLVTQTEGRDIQHLLDVSWPTPSSPDCMEVAAVSSLAL